MMKKLPVSIDEDGYVEDRDFTRLVVGKAGKFVIPADMLAALGFSEGEQLVARNENGRLVIETREQVKQRLQARFAHLPKEKSLSEELIQERRAAAEREDNS